MKTIREYCDNCGELVYKGGQNERCVVTTLPCDIDSANEGESATLCKECFDMIMRKVVNKNG
tara:strand:+ start:65 stop:250 length:186 start_codon:yes stop_codon:yes gene_type:complete